MIIGKYNITKTGPRNRKGCGGDNDFNPSRSFALLLSQAKSRNFFKNQPITISQKSSNETIRTSLDFFLGIPSN
jgi:hypothetical protein